MNQQIDTVKNIENLYNLKNQLSQMSSITSSISSEINSEKEALNKIESYSDAKITDESDEDKTIKNPTATEPGQRKIYIVKFRLDSNVAAANGIFSKILDNIGDLNNQINSLNKKIDDAINSNELASDYEKAVEAGLADGMSFLDYTISEYEKLSPSEFTFTEADMEILKQYVTTDEYRAQNGDYDGISQQNLQWWTDDVSSFKRDPNGLGTTSYVINQQNAGMGFIPAEAYLAILANHAKNSVSVTDVKPSVRSEIVNFTKVKDDKKQEAYYKLSPEARKIVDGDTKIKGNDGTFYSFSSSDNHYQKVDTSKYVSVASSKNGTDYAKSITSDNITNDLYKNGELVSQVKDSSGNVIRTNKLSSDGKNISVTLYDNDHKTVKTVQVDASSKQINSTAASDYDNKKVSIEGAKVPEFTSVANDTSKYDSVTNYFETLNQ